MLTSSLVPKCPPCHSLFILNFSFPSNPRNCPGNLLKTEGLMQNTEEMVVIQSRTKPHTDGLVLATGVSPQTFKSLLKLKGPMLER